MNRMFESLPRHALGGALVLAMLAACANADAAAFQVLYNFQGGASDGGNPASGLVPDGQGGFYGTTPIGSYRSPDGSNPLRCGKSRASDRLD